MIHVLTMQRPPPTQTELELTELVAVILKMVSIRQTISTSLQRYGLSYSCLLSLQWQKY